MTNLLFLCSASIAPPPFGHQIIHLGTPTPELQNLIFLTSSANLLNPTLEGSHPRTQIKGLL